MTKFQELVKRFAASKAVMGLEPWLPKNDIWLSEWQDFDIDYRKAQVARYLPALPRAYRSAYGEKLLHNMENLERKLHEEYDKQAREGMDESFLASKAADWLAVLVDAVLNWEGRSIENLHERAFNSTEIRRFAVVVSDFYSIFRKAYDEFRTSLGNRLPDCVDELPPLVTFSPTRIWGPHTINADNVDRLIGARVGVVSLPSVFKTAPLLWVPLAHEVFGHDITHALGRSVGIHKLPHLASQLRDKIQHDSDLDPEWRPSWQKWSEELAADIYGLVCMGPHFAISLAALMSATACGDPFGPCWSPGLVRTTLVARGGRAYDEHPPDLLRLHALIGAIEALPVRDCNLKAGWVSMLEQVVSEAQPPSCMIEVYDFDAQDVLMHYRPDVLMRDARKLGKFIAEVPLNDLGKRPILSFHSWNDRDEATARKVEAQAAKFTSNQERLSLPRSANASHLLAGATMAAYADPTAFAAITEFLNRALDERAATNQRLRRMD
jgi:hypothetical protein